MQNHISVLTKNYERTDINGKIISIPYPDEIPFDFNFVGREALLDCALAAWAKMPGLKPMNFRLYGPPGTGKNALVYRLSQFLKKPLYIMTGNEDLGPEDIACTPIARSDGKYEYSASPLFAAMLRGGICFFDEIGKMPAKALDALIPVLDDRRTLKSILAGIQLKAHDDFLFCAALNEKEEGLSLPDYLDERTRPAIYVGIPSRKEMEEIIKTRIVGTSEDWVRIFIEQFKDKELSPRDALRILDYGYRLCKEGNGKGPLCPESIRGYLNAAFDLKKYLKEEEEASSAIEGDDYEAEHIMLKEEDTIH